MIVLTRCQHRLYTGGRCAIPVRDGDRRYCHVHAPTPDRKPTWAEETARKCPEAVGWADMLTGALSEESPPRVASPCLRCGGPLSASRCHREVCDRCGGTWDLDAELEAAWRERTAPIRVPLAATTSGGHTNRQMSTLPARGTIAARVLGALMAGPRTRAELCERLGDDLSPTQVSTGLQQLKNARLVEQEGPSRRSRYRRVTP